MNDEKNSNKKLTKTAKILIVAIISIVLLFAIGLGSTVLTMKAFGEQNSNPTITTPKTNLTE